MEQPPNNPETNNQPGRLQRLRATTRRHPLRTAATVLLVLVVTMAAAAYLTSQVSDQPEVLVSQPPAKVEITRSGFMPATLSVKAGTKVSWTNRDSRPHQVAGDPYPKNDSIPGLESTTVLEPGESLHYTFTKPGSYTYHDQLNPFRLKGTVVVE